MPGQYSLKGTKNDPRIPQPLDLCRMTLASCICRIFDNLRSRRLQLRRLRQRFEMQNWRPDSLAAQSSSLGVTNELSRLTSNVPNSFRKVQVSNVLQQAMPSCFKLHVILLRWSHLFQLHFLFKTKTVGSNMFKPFLDRLSFSCTLPPVMICFSRSDSVLGQAGFWELFLLCPSLGHARRQKTRDPVDIQWHLQTLLKLMNVRNSTCFDLQIDKKLLGGCFIF